jgi:hypothetical protein
MNDDLNKTTLRTRQYWYIDGLAELALAAVCLLLAVYFTLQVTLPHETLLATLLDSGFVLILIGSFLLARRLVEIAKTRLTYPRTGYVSYPKDNRGKRWIRAVIAMLMGATISALMISAPASLAWMPAITGFAFSAALLFFAYRIHLWRFYFLSAVALISGAFLSIIGIGNITGLAVFYALFSLALFISGGFTLRCYLGLTRSYQNS